MQGFFSQTTDTIAFKLHTLFGHHQITLQEGPKKLYQNLTQLGPFLDSATTDDILT